MTKRRAKRIAVIMWQRMANEDWCTEKGSESVAKRPPASVSDAKACILNDMRASGEVTTAEFCYIFSNSSSCPLCTYFKQVNKGGYLCRGCPLEHCHAPSLFSRVRLDNKESMLAVLNKIKAWEVK